MKNKKVLAIVLAAVVLFLGLVANLGSDNDVKDESNTTTEVITTVEALKADDTEKATAEETKKTTGSAASSTTEMVVNSDNLSSDKADVSSVAGYSGSPYITLNDGKPNFTAASITKTAFESYASLDYLGRCGVAYACLGEELMPADGEERGSISNVKPSGWNQAKYDFVNNKYLYNRCHLIGWQLSAENANKRNLITGTRYMNVEGMLPFENMVADYIKETGNHVMYRVTPVFEGSELLCRGVQIEAYSVEDAGDGICFNVYVYNVQPGVSIDYSDGSSKASGSSSATQKAEPVTTKKEATAKETTTEKTDSADEVIGEVWIPKSGKKYHSHSGCSNMKNPSCVTKEEAESRGYTPCKKCW